MSNTHEHIFSIFLSNLLPLFLCLSGHCFLCCHKGALLSKCATCNLSRHHWFSCYDVTEVKSSKLIAKGGLGEPWEWNSHHSVLKNCLCAMLIVVDKIDWVTLELAMENHWTETDSWHLLLVVCDALFRANQAAASHAPIGSFDFPCHIFKWQKCSCIAQA